MKVTNEKVLKKIKRLPFIMKEGYEIRMDFNPVKNDITQERFYVFDGKDWFEFDHIKQALCYVTCFLM